MVIVSHVVDQSYKRSPQALPEVARARREGNAHGRPRKIFDREKARMLRSEARVRGRLPNRSA
jgi:hypothetical protein